MKENKIRKASAKEQLAALRERYEELKKKIETDDLAGKEAK